MFRIARTSLWHHAAFAERLALEPDMLLDTFDHRGNPDLAWAALQQADVYQISSSRDELPAPFHARADLLAAADACRTTPDETEPDGQPTPGRPPHSSLHYNVHYHLGLACFLLGDWRQAEHAWLCCLAVADDDESRVAVTHWLWCARMRMGDRAGAAAVVAPIHERLDVVENVAYLNLCMLYAGRRTREQITPREGSSGSALAFGLAHHELVTGNRDEALLALFALAQSSGWSAFGVIAAEAELARARD